MEIQVDYQGKMYLISNYLRLFFENFTSNHIKKSNSGKMKSISITINQTFHVSCGLNTFQTVTDTI